MKYKNYEFSVSTMFAIRGISMTKRNYRFIQFIILEMIQFKTFAFIAKLIKLGRWCSHLK